MKMQIIMLFGFLGMLSGCGETGHKDQRLAHYGKGLPKGESTPIMEVVADKSLVLNDKLSGDKDGDGVIDLRDVSNKRLGRSASVDNVGRGKVLSDVKELDLLVQFPTGKKDVNHRYYAEIEKLARLHNNDKKDKKILIEGHTDSTGGRNNNLELSLGRAEAIAKLLIKKYNVNAADILVSGAGPDKPIASNKTANGRQQNRRMLARMVYGDRIVKSDWNVWTVEQGDKRGEIQRYRSIVDEEEAKLNATKPKERKKL